VCRGNNRFTEQHELECESIWKIDTNKAFQYGKGKIDLLRRHLKGDDDPNDSEVVDLDALGYRELQSLCREKGLPSRGAATNLKRLLRGDTKVIEIDVDSDNDSECRPIRKQPKQSRQHQEGQANGADDTLSDILPRAKSNDSKVYKNFPFFPHIQRQSSKYNYYPQEFLSKETFAAFASQFQEKHTAMILEQQKEFCREQRDIFEGLLRNGSTASNPAMDHIMNEAAKASEHNRDEERKRSNLALVNAFTHREVSVDALKLFHGAISSGFSSANK